MEEMSVLIEKSHAGDKQAREVLIEKNLGLVHHIVKRFLNRGVDAEDLFQIGCIGLMKAIDKFDLAFDVKFSTYAVPMKRENTCCSSRQNRRTPSRAVSPNTPAG